MTNSRTLALRGFTLIELLVVIAIIGILSAVVLASLNTARSKGNDAAVKSNLVTVQTQAELFYDSNGSKYNTDGSTGVAVATCPTTGATMFAADPTIKAAIAAATSAGGTAVCYMKTDGQAYAIQVPLKAVANTYWCVDSTGQGKQEGAAMATGATACL
ncbi:MAG: type II secretion system protein [bacterium]